MTKARSIRAGAVVLVVVVSTALVAACGGDSSGGLSVLDGSSPSTSPSATSTPSPTTSVTPSETASASPTATADDTADAGGDTTGNGSGDVSADEFSTYVGDVAPWYAEITAVEAAMIKVIEQVETNQISPGQGGRRLERLGYRLDPPVVELASMSVPPALDEAHTAWLDGISFEARGFARLAELMAAGTYQRGAVDPQYDSLMTKASAKWSEWQSVVEPYEAELGIDVPWSWPNE